MNEEKQPNFLFEDDKQVDNSKKILKVNLAKVRNIHVNPVKKFAYFLTFIFIFPILKHQKRGQWFLAERQNLNDQLVQIDAKLFRLYEIFLKEIDASKFLMKGESEKDFIKTVKDLNDVLMVLDSTVQVNPLQIAQKDRLIARIAHDWKIIKGENREIASIPLIKSFDATIQKLEKELVAMRRVYILAAREFNSMLIKYPSNIIAQELNLEKMPVFENSDEKRQDVALKY